MDEFDTKYSLELARLSTIIENELGLDEENDIIENSSDEETSGNQVGSFLGNE